MSRQRVRIMFLDDDEGRHRIFSDMIGRSADIVHVRSYDEAVRELAASCVDPFDIVFLDHDLSEEDVMILPGQPTKCKTGMDVVSYITSMQEGVRPSRAVVHSMNTPAREQMVVVLGSVGIDAIGVPFHRLDVSIESMN